MSTTAPTKPENGPSTGPEIKINLDELPANTREYILKLAVTRDISPADAAIVVLNYIANAA